MRAIYLTTRERCGISMRQLAEVRLLRKTVDMKGVIYMPGRVMRVIVPEFDMKEVYPLNANGLRLAPYEFEFVIGDEEYEDLLKEMA